MIKAHVYALKKLLAVWIGLSFIFLYGTVICWLIMQKETIFVALSIFMVLFPLSIIAFYSYLEEYLFERELNDFTKRKIERGETGKAVLERLVRPKGNSKNSKRN